MFSAGNYEYCGSRIGENIASAKPAAQVVTASAEMKELEEREILPATNTGTKSWIRKKAWVHSCQLYLR